MSFEIYSETHILQQRNADLSFLIGQIHGSLAALISLQMTDELRRDKLRHLGNMLDIRIADLFYAKTNAEDTSD